MPVITIFVLIETDGDSYCCLSGDCASDNYFCLSGDCASDNCCCLCGIYVPMTTVVIVNIMCQ